MDTRKRRNPSAQTSKQSIPISNILQSAPVSIPITSVPPPEPIKVFPLTIFDFNGSPLYYEHMSPFIDTSALHLICIHTADFHQAIPTAIEDIFNGTIDTSSSSNIISQLFQILQFLCEKATKSHAIMIVPIATCIDLYVNRPKQDK
jgi:hypothetical protein